MSVKSSKNRVSVKNSGTSVSGVSYASAVRAEVVNRVNGFQPKWLVVSPSAVDGCISSFECGRYHDCMPLLERVYRNSPQVVICSQKRLSMVVGGGWEVVVESSLNSDVERSIAERQANAIRWCLNGIRVGDVRSRDCTLGFHSLVEMIMSGVAFGYVLGSIEWRSIIAPNGEASYSPTITHVPLSMCDARDKRLCLIDDNCCPTGELPKGDWLLAKYNSPLMPATLVLHALKTPAEVDWASTTLKYGVPFVWAKTQAEYGSEAWVNAENAISKVGSDFGAVVGGDVELNTMSLAQGSSPHERVADYYDRAIARLWLGGDLDTMSRGERGVGSDAQSGREDFLRSSDRSFVESVIDSQIIQPLLRKLGYGKQLAYFKFGVKEARDINSLQVAVNIASQTGIEIPVDWLYEQLGIPRPQESDPTIKVLPNNPAFLQHQVYSNAEKVVENGVGASGTRVVVKKPSDKEIASAVVKGKAEQFAPVLAYLKRFQEAKTDDEKKIILLQLESEFPEISRMVLDGNQEAKALAESIRSQIGL